MFRSDRDTRARRIDQMNQARATFTNMIDEMRAEVYRESGVMPELEELSRLAMLEILREQGDMIEGHVERFRIFHQEEIVKESEPEKEEDEDEETLLERQIDSIRKKGVDDF